MNVLLVSHHYPPDAVGGVERITQALASDLARQGDCVAIVTRRFGPQTTVTILKELSPEGIPVYRLSGGYFSNETFLQYHQELETLFGGVLQEVAPDLVHVLHLRGLSPRFIEMARARGAAVVVSLQDFGFACPRITLLNTGGEWCAGPAGGARCAQTCFANEGIRARRWELRARYWESMLQEAHRVICPSGYMADFFRAHGAEAERVRVIPNGVSLPPPASWEADTERLPGAALKLLFLGTVLPHKGAHLILDALATVPVGAVDLILAGAADDREYVRRLRAQAAAIPGLRMRFFGAYEIRELTWLLRDVDCVITPSAWPEAFGIVTREALRRGVPVLVSRVGGLAEAVVEGVNGFTFASENPEELGLLLTRLAREEGLLARLREGAQATRVLTTAEHARAVKEIYLEAHTEAQSQRFTVKAESEKAFEALLGAGFGEASSDTESRKSHML